MINYHNGCSRAPSVSVLYLYIPRITNAANKKKKKHIPTLDFRGNIRTTSAAHAERVPHARGAVPRPYLVAKRAENRPERRPKVRSRSRRNGRRRAPCRGSVRPGLAFGHQPPPSPPEKSIRSGRPFRRDEIRRRLIDAHHYVCARFYNSIFFF